MVETESRSAVAWGLGWEWGLTANVPKEISGCGNGCVLYTFIKLKMNI